MIMKCANEVYAKVSFCVCHLSSYMYWSYSKQIKKSIKFSYTSEGCKIPV